MKYNEDGTLSAESKKEIISAIEKHGYDNVSNAALWGYAGPSDIGQDMLKTFGISGAETNRDFTMVHMYAFEYKHNKKEASHDAIIPDPIYPCVFMNDSGHSRTCQNPEGFFKQMVCPFFRDVTKCSRHKLNMKAK